VTPLRSACRTALLALVLLATCTSGSLARTNGAAGAYPRLGLYGSIHGNGYPFYNAPADSNLDPAVLDAVARYDVVILDVNPITPYRPDILAALRARHPGIQLLAYVVGHDTWGSADPDSMNHFPTRYLDLVRDLDGFLYNSVDDSLFDNADVNLAKQDANGHFVVAEGLADLFNSAILATGQWDGLFIDVFCSDITWLQDATHQIDYVRAGYPTLSAFLAAWSAATDTLANRLRREAGPGPIIVGNCGVSAHHGVFNGWMRENFPYQSGGTWFSNVMVDPNGYLADDRDYVAPAHDFLFTISSGDSTTNYSSDNTRKVRYGLGSAALGQGYGVFGPARDSYAGPYHMWWYDEYAVDVPTGHAMTDLAHTGWLGQPLGPPYQMIWAGNQPDAVTNPDFETDVTTGWDFGHFAPAAATIARDTTTAAVNRASCHIDVTATGPDPWDVNLATTGQLYLDAGISYSATFWAKASSARVMPVTATIPTGGSAAAQNVTLDTTWTHYQVVFTPSSSANTVLEFFLGSQTGDVWFDDVHFQRGVTNLWRRDFDNGIVLVNPSNSAQAAPLGGTWRKIAGIEDPVTNDGSLVTTATVNPSDALFLVTTSSDLVPPASITDAHVKP